MYSVSFNSVKPLNISIGKTMGYLLRPHPLHTHGLTWTLIGFFFSICDDVRHCFNCKRIALKVHTHCNLLDIAASFEPTKTEMIQCLQQCHTPDDDDHISFICLTYELI